METLLDLKDLEEDCPILPIERIDLTDLTECEDEYRLLDEDWCELLLLPIFPSAGVFEDASFGAVFVVVTPDPSAVNASDWRQLPETPTAGGGG